jgi:hypothetical protein
MEKIAVLEAQEHCHISKSSHWKNVMEYGNIYCATDDTK